MLIPANFLDKYDVILFDMDGVVTSEQAYWTTAALTVYEFLFSNKYYGKEDTNDKDLIRRQAEIREMVFIGDKTISALKNKGVNSNWDLSYLVVGIAISLDTRDFSEIYEYCSSLGSDIFAEYDALAHMLSKKFGDSKDKYIRGGEFWQSIVDAFQRFYLGDGKENSIIYGEQPLHDLETTKTVLKTLADNGKTLGIGTGRLLYEIEYPLTKWGLYDLFASDRIVTYNNIIDDEKVLEDASMSVSLTKPHPYMFLKGALKNTFPAEKIIAKDYDREILKKVLVVGDAGADLYSAQNAGMDFLAVLTGVSGQSARVFFEGKADYILDSICDMIKNS